SDLVQNGEFFWIQHAARGQREIEEQVTIPADNIDQHVDYDLGRFVRGLFVVMPGPDAGVGLPRLVPDAIDYATLEIEHAGAVHAIVLAFVRPDALDLAVELPGDGVVVMRH